jgi:hypothetical protein
MMVAASVMGRRPTESRCSTMQRYLIVRQYLIVRYQSRKVSHIRSRNTNELPRFDAYRDGDTLVAVDSEASAALEPAKLLGPVMSVVPSVGSLLAAVSVRLVVVVVVVLLCLNTEPPGETVAPAEAAG